MRKVAAVFLCSSFLAGAQQLDFSSLDKLASKAKEVNRVSLDREQMRAALAMLSGVDQKSGKDLASLSILLNELTSIEVRNFEFDKPGSYKDADLATIREQLGKLKNWSKVIDSKEDGERSEIFLCTEGGKTKGLAIVAAEASELSVVLLKGNASLQALSGLGGILGIASMKLGPRPAETKK